ncbi:cupin domain-containing protein [Almyronema epifaneia]|uniref:Cupin domain-containing protein n=1 Tax=Almyronema epifaneia S1 TaxID=2991925 RepID=A0ABW6IA89_9CYAN
MLIDPNQVPDQTGTGYPEPLRQLVEGRIRKRVGNAAGLTNFGVNLVTLLPGSGSALRHWHTAQDEFVYVIAGMLTLITEAGEQLMTPGMMAGFAAGTANGHHLVNRSEMPAVYLEIGDRSPNDIAHYPDADLVARHTGSHYLFTRKDGRPY